VIEGRIKYYEVFKYVDGTILRNLLLKNPQPWYQHVGWITLSVADCVYYLHRAGKLHLCLNPDVILVRFDKQGIPRPVLLDLGVADPGQTIYELWNENYNLAAYTAPEIADGRSGVGPATDVYGLGVLLYEMLAGRPAYEYHLKKDPAVLKNVMEGEFKPTGRIDLKNIPEIAERSITRQYDQRFPDVPAFVTALQLNFPPIPAERRSFHVNWRIIFIIIGALLVISLLTLLALSSVPG
jgi:serine/threonine protein kinase